MRKWRLQEVTCESLTAIKGQNGPSHPVSVTLDLMSLTTTTRTFCSREVGRKICDGRQGRKVFLEGETFCVENNAGGLDGSVSHAAWNLKPTLQFGALQGLL